MSEASRPLDGKVAIITGGGSGIGKATAKLLASRGAKVAVTGRTVANLTKTVSELEAAGGQAMAVAMDVSNEESIANGIAKVVDQFGRLELMPRNAAQTENGRTSFREKVRQYCIIQEG